ncbi:MAG: hypothetical protein KC593_21270 [Myxococcales bacterium]|nr:hypothetical protein [Myxococcales bacterium]MCB9627003.1 hypothetical protein [Sandaracinaceae bacterium]
MTLAHKTRALLLLGALPLLGCPEPGFTMTQMAPLPDALLAVDDVHARARVLQLAERGTGRLDFDLGDGAATLLSRGSEASGSTEVLVFTSGVPAEEGEEGSVAELVRVSSAGPEGTPWRFHDQYESVRLAGEERYAMAFAPLGRLVVDNRVELADLAAEPSDSNPVGLSLRSLGGEVPTDVAVSRPLGVGGGELRVVALLASGQLSLFDLDAPDLPPVTIPTNAVPGTTGPRPVEAVFVGERIVVRTEGGSQLLVVTLLTEDSGTGQRFDVTLSTLITGGPVRRLIVDERSSTPRLLAVGSGVLNVFDLDAGLRETVTLSAGQDQALLFEGTAPGDPNVRDRLVLFGATGRLTFVDFGAAPLDIRSVGSLQLDFTPIAMTADVTSAQLVAFRQGSGFPDVFDIADSRGRTPGALVSLEDRSATPLSTTGIDRAVMSHDLTTLWVADGDGYVSRFDTVSLMQDETWLGAKVEFLVPLPGAAGLVLAFTNAATGSFTVMDPSAADSSRWRRFHAAF